MDRLQNWLFELIDKIVIKAGAVTSITAGGWSLLQGISWLTILSAAVAILTCISLIVRIWIDLSRNAREKHVFNQRDKRAVDKLR